LLGILFVISISFVEKTFFNILNLSTNPNIVLVYKSIISSIFLFLMFLVYGTYINFFNDINFYILLILEAIVILKAKYIYKLFETRFVYLSFALFSSIYLMPFISYFYKEFFGFSNNLAFIFDDLASLFLFSFSLFILNILFFIEKLKEQSNNNINKKELVILLFFAFLMVNTLYFATNMIQKYEPYSLYSAILIPQILIFSVIGLKKKEKLTINRKELIVIPSHIVAILLSIFGAKLLAVEFFTIFKRLGTIYASYFFDYLNNPGYKVLKKELYILFSITFLVLGVFIFS